MEITTTIRAIGGSLAITIPKPIAHTLKLEADAKVSVTVKDGQMVMRASPKRYTLADLMSQCDLSLPETAEARAWSESAAVGREWGSAEFLAAEEAADPAWVAHIEALYDAAG